MPNFKNIGGVERFVFCMLKICKYKNSIKTHSSLNGKTSQNNSDNDSSSRMFYDIFVELCASYQVHLVTKYLQLCTFDSIAERTQWKECVKGKEKEDAKSRASYDHDTMERKVGRPEDVVPGFCLMGIPR